MFKLNLEKVEEPEIKLTIYAGSQKIQENSRRMYVKRINEISFSQGKIMNMPFDQLWDTHDTTSTRVFFF